MSQYCACVANKANGIWDCIRSRDLNFLLYPALVRPHLEFCVQFWTPHYRRDMELLGRVHQMTTSMFIWGEAGRAGNIFLGEKEPGGSSSMSINAWKECAKKRKPGSFQWCSVTGQEAMAKLETKKHLFTVRVTERCHRLSREVTESSFLEVFKSHLVIVLGSLLLVTLLEQRSFTRWPPQVPFRISDCTWNRRWLQDISGGIFYSQSWVSDICWVSEDGNILTMLREDWYMIFALC